MTALPTALPAPPAALAAPVPAAPTPRERGSAAALRLMGWIARRLGPGVARTLLPPVVLYFLLSSPRQRANARAFQARARGRPATWRDLWGQYLGFGAALLDRVHLLLDGGHGYRIEVHGLDALRARLDRGEGCVLLGAHLGSFESLRALAQHGCPVEVLALMQEQTAARANAFFAALAPGLADTVAPLGRPETMLRAREVLERGGLVGLLADRAPPGARAVRAELLGAPARLPAGPFLLAGLLGAPVFLAFGLRLGSRHYAIRFEPFAERLRLDRRDREASLAAHAARYAARLGELARAHPDNWFNFHDAWADPPRP